MSVAWELMLPTPEAGEEEATGKELGIVTAAVDVPQPPGPIMAPVLLSAAGDSHPAPFVVSGAFVLVGSFLVLPIRSVR